MSVCFKCSARQIALQLLIVFVTFQNEGSSKAFTFDNEMKTSPLRIFLSFCKQLYLSLLSTTEHNTSLSLQRSRRTACTCIPIHLNQVCLISLMAGHFSCFAVSADIQISHKDINHLMWWDILHEQVLGEHTPSLIHHYYKYQFIVQQPKKDPLKDILYPLNQLYC